MNPTGSLAQVLSGQYVRTVFQPIVSLKQGGILGYEALSRITLPACSMNIEQLFEEAARAGKLWELEKLCRTHALLGACDKPPGAKIFLNVDPNTLYDQAFIAGFTREMLSEFGLDSNDIIFEITEKRLASSVESFTDAIEHYQQQNYQIAIDDFGSGYSGLARACAFSPNYLKVDMSIVHGIDRDSRKRSAVMGIVKFCQEADIKIIAEGIETPEELSTLMQLGVQYGQGYLLGLPGEGFQGPASECSLLMAGLGREHREVEFVPSIFGTVGEICRREPAVKPADRALSIYEAMRANPSMTEVCVVDDENRVRGILTRNYLVGRFSGQFGYSLCYRRTVGELLSPDYMAVDCGATVDKVASMAMERDFSSVYDAVVVTESGRYVGVVTVRDLLTAAISIREKNAADANPLTGLPGNNAIQSAIGAVLQGCEPYAIIYLDLDNFKAYNDAYGFANGDSMLKELSQAILCCCPPEDFKGHIGGDDFVIVTRNIENLSDLCNALIEVFGRLIEPLYTRTDWERGYIESKDRNGFQEEFPIATLSIAAVTSRSGPYAEAATLSKAIASAKKQCKKQKGNAVVVI